MIFDVLLAVDEKRLPPARGKGSLFDGKRFLLEGVMTPGTEIIRSKWPEIDERLVQEHLARLEKSYFESGSSPK